MLLVLDGFDEVADISLRNKIVSETRNATVRLSEGAISVQTIVTSRPAAFANSPGFPKDEWQHVQLRSLNREAISAYSERWLAARGVENREGKMIRRVLDEKLQQPHVRDLARNPMQLAILLALISVQGASLPDKRTALYDKYIDIFMDRESEKNSVVRDHRELLIHMHRFIAWKLQGESEASSSPGNISERKLRLVLSEFLESQGHPTTLIDKLFTGMVERVVALVSRIQGTYEFEVQPLREYFAARYLHDTAPYSPPGRERSGTLPERFDAIARNFYWLNVTRFYAGCYSSGELSSLVDGLEELQESPQFTQISHVQRLTATLLNDHVFNQQPKLVAKLAARIVTPEALRIMLGNSYRDYPNSISLPVGPARDSLLTSCKVIIESERRPDFIRGATQILCSNMGRVELFQYWRSLKDILDEEVWLSVGGSMEVFLRMNKKEISEIIKECSGNVVPLVLRWGRYDVFTDASEDWMPALRILLDDNNTIMPGPIRGEGMTGMAVIAGPIFNLFSTYVNEMDFRAEREYNFVTMLNHRTPLFVPDGLLLELLVKGSEPIADEFRELVSAADTLMQSKLPEIARDPDPWSNLLEVARSIWGDRWALYRTAVFVAGAVDRSKITHNVSLFDPAVPMLLRAREARRRATDRDWWVQQINTISEPGGSFSRFALLCIFTWMPVADILRSADDLSAKLDSLPTDDWLALAEAMSGKRVGPQMGRRLANNPDDTGRSAGRSTLWRSELPPSISVRLAALLVYRLPIMSGHLIWIRYLKDYRGSDVAVLEACTRVVTERAARNSEEWADALPVIAHAYAEGVVSFGLVRHAHGHGELPLVEAEHVCSNASHYPLALLASAESALAARAGAAAVPVSKIASDNHWFAVGD